MKVKKINYKNCLIKQNPLTGNYFVYAEPKNDTIPVIPPYAGSLKGAKRAIDHLLTHTKYYPRSYS